MMELRQKDVRLLLSFLRRRIWNRPMSLLHTRVTSISRPVNRVCKSHVFNAPRSPALSGVEDHQLQMQRCSWTRSLGGKPWG